MIKNIKDANPFDLKVLENEPKDYLDTDDFSKFLKKKNISVREDNLPRFADRHDIKMAKKIREGSAGSVPTIYKIPSKAKLEQIIKTMSLNNNNSLGKENIKKKEKKILEIFDKAIILKSELLEKYVRNLITTEDIAQIIIGNGTTSREIREKLYFFKKEILTFEEKNTTLRAKARYFELFPIKGLKFLIPREVFLINKNLDAISALIILEDYCKMKFTLNQNIDFKTWLK